jgi:hypothetical protein
MAQRKSAKKGPLSAALGMSVRLAGFLFGKYSLAYGVSLLHQGGCFVTTLGCVFLHFYIGFGFKC